MDAQRGEKTGLFGELPLVYQPGSITQDLRGDSQMAVLTAAVPVTNKAYFAYDESEDFAKKALCLHKTHHTYFC